MKFLNRPLAVGLTWGLLEAALVVLPLYLYGIQPVSSFFFLGTTSLSSTVIPVGWLVLVIAFVSTFALADIGGAIKALVLSEALAFGVSASMVAALPGFGGFSTSGETATFFAILAIGFFLSAVTGTVFGSLLGAWVREQPGEYTVTIRRHRVLSIVLILGLTILLTLVSLGSFVALQAENYAVTNLLKDPVTVANQTSSWNAGAQMVWANLTGNYGSGELEILWASTTNVSLHYIPVYLTSASYSELVGRSECFPTQVPCRGLSDVLIEGIYGHATIWFQIDGCPVSGCPSGWVEYQITYWHY